MVINAGIIAVKCIIEHSDDIVSYWNNIFEGEDKAQITRLIDWCGAKTPLGLLGLKVRAAGASGLLYYFIYLLIHSISLYFIILIDR